MPNQISPKFADYHSAVQKYEIMKTAERMMNNPNISKTKRKHNAVKFKEYRNVLVARDYCPNTKPATK